MLKCAGRFFIYTLVTMKTLFSKTYVDAQDLVKLLKQRGLSVNDEGKAQHYLTHIGYYRLSAYMYPLLQIPK